ncbi:AAA family ATPase [Mycolicibacterium cosmeticum]|uniref:AAA family ATPase n=1 Tax=Mycolicibacterium cosmeticum TaxID=258533 RepID=UPI00042A2FB2
MSLVVGGVVPPENVVGRVREQQEILASVPHGGAALVGDRRHGKTSLARLVAHTAREHGWPVISVSAERQTYAEFVSALAGELGRLDTMLRQEVERWKIAFGTGPVRFERARAEAALDDLLQRAVGRARGGPLVLFIDEVTVLARNLEREKPGGGDGFLHLLRRLRQEHSGRLATVLSGSIGFHHVSGDALSSVNDIRKVTVGPIRPDHATYLAECLLLGAQVDTTDRHAVATAVAAAAEHVPYYIQHLVAAAARLGEPVSAEHIPLLLDAAIADPHDPWDLRHYRDRLRNYYGDDAPAIAELLDIYAHASEPLSVNVVLRLLHSEGSPITDKDQLVSFVERLEQDHYLRRHGDDDTFASGLVQRAWQAMRR